MGDRNSAAFENQISSTIFEWTGEISVVINEIGTPKFHQQYKTRGPRATLLTGATTQNT